MDYKELEQKVGDMPSYILTDDFKMYAKYLPSLKKGETIVDLGTGWGKSATAMGLANPNIIIWTIDDGSYPIYQRWAKNPEDYAVKILGEFKSHGVKNILLFVKDVVNAAKSSGIYPLIHLDLTKEREVETLKAWLPHVKVGGVILIRNLNRMKEQSSDTIATLLADFDYLESAGLIHVYRRIQ